MVQVVTGSNRQAWRGHYNLVGTQGRTQLHETRSSRVRRQHIVNSRQETEGWLGQLGATNPKRLGVYNRQTKGVTSGRTSRGAAA